jgi:hypothetical protein
MITNNIDNKVRVTVGTTPLIFTNIVSIDVTKGGDISPYRTGPDVGSMTVNLGYKAGETLPSTTTLQTGMQIVLQAFVSSSWVSHLTMNISDVVYNKEFNSSKNAYDTVISIYAIDSVQAIESVYVPGVVTAVNSLNVTWESRITNKLGPYFTSPKVLPSTGTEAHVYRLVDNNASGSLADQLNLACNSVGAMWYVDMDNTAKFNARGAYPKTGMLFTDQAGYWTSGNKPANAGSTIFYNLEYNEIETSFDSASIVNSVTVENILPRNQIVGGLTTPGVFGLVYKDPATTKPELLECLTTSFTSTDATSITNFGRRTDALQTNLFPYRTTDPGQNYFIRYNAIPDPGCEYQNGANFSPALRLDYTWTTATPKTGVYSARFRMTTADTSAAIYLGPSGGFPFRYDPLLSGTGSATPYLFSIRSSYTPTTIFAGTEFIDSNGNSVGISNPPGLGVSLTANTWTAVSGYLLRSAIPANAVAFRPRIVLQRTGANFPVGTTWQIDDLMVEPNILASNEFSGDTPDAFSTMYGWEGEPGSSYSYVTRNINQNVGTDVLSYWSTNDYNVKYLRWNAAQNLAALATLSPTARVDVRTGGTNYTAWISQIKYRITPEAWYTELSLSTRPTSWI